MIINKQIANDGGYYWLAEQNHHGRRLLAEGNNSSEAMRAMYELMREHNERWKAEVMAIVNDFGRCTECGAFHGTHFDGCIHDFR